MILTNLMMMMMLLGAEERCSYAFFLKMMPGVEEKHKLLIQDTRVFVREVEANQLVLAEMTNFLAKACSKLKIPRPQVIFGTYDDRGWGILVEMDLNDEGFFPLNHSNGFNLPQLLVVIEKLAEFHAIGSAIFLSDESNSIFHQGLAKLANLSSGLSPGQHDKLFQDFTRFLRKVPGYVHCQERAEQAKPYLKHISCQAKQERNSNFPVKTLLHGELWEKNILLRFEQITSTLEVVFCDWKRLHCGTPEQDLAFLVLTCTNKAIRTRNLDTIVEAYYNAYRKALLSLGLDFDQKFPRYSLKAFRQDYEASLIPAFGQAALIMTRELKYQEIEFFNADDVEEAEMERIGTNLRCFGRRLLDLAEEYVPSVQIPTNGALESGVKTKVKAKSLGTAISNPQDARTA